ncbi:B12-binding domain-containing radical SAM protein [Rhodospirillum sp. A1_3_36]|uniref:B12-binding domain-containing radical SAM protein n=1 Tax=Rhodospirillum sp. A1_3_36 TaxID=3391666 RepID=UPI0039A65C78
MSIDVLLVNPPYRLVPPFTYDQYEQIDPPRNLAILAAWLEKRGISVAILDATILEMSFEDMERDIRRLAPRVVGITNRSTSTFPMVERTAGLVKEIDPTIPVVVGGTYVSWMPLEAIRRCDDIDYLVVGEGDRQGPDLFECLLSGRSPDGIPGLVLRDPLDRDKVRQTPPGPVVETLAEVPFPAYHLVPLEKYVARGERYILSLTRGCIFRCEYCTSSFERGRVRFHAIADLIAEVTWAYDQGFRYFYFYDDILTVDRKKAVILCEELIATNLPIKWHCLTRTEYVDPDLLALMARAGCDRIAYGVESASESNLAMFQRKSRNMRSAFDMTKAAGIRSIAFAVFGMPGETMADQLKTIRMLKELGPDMVRDFTYKPYPGTRHYAEPDRWGIHITDRDYVRWSQQDEPVHHTDHLTEEEIIEVRVLCSYIFRGHGKVEPGPKFRRKKKVVLLKTADGGLIYNGHKKEEERRVDLYLNCLKVTELYFEVMLHCDGYHTIEDIAQKIERLFGYERTIACRKVEKVLQHAESLGMLTLMPAFLPEDSSESAFAEVDPARLPAEDRILVDPNLERASMAQR